MSIAAQERISHHSGGHASVVIGQTLVSPDRYPAPENEKPHAVMNGPFIEVVDPLGELHTYLMPRVMKGLPKFGVPDETIFAILEVKKTHDGFVTNLVQEVDITQKYAQKVGGQRLNFEDIRVESSDSTIEAEFAMPQTTSRSRTRALQTGESVQCGMTAVGEDGVPYVGFFRLQPVAGEDGSIQFVVNDEDIEVTEFHGKNVLPLSDDLAIYRPEWEGTLRRGTQIARQVNRNRFSYLKKIDGRGGPYGEDSILPQGLIGTEGRYGLVGGDPICVDQKNHIYVLLFHEFQLEQNGTGVITGEKGESGVLEYALIKVRAQRRKDKTWRFLAIGKKPVITYGQTEGTDHIDELRPQEKHVVYGVDARENNEVVEIPLNTGDTKIVYASVGRQELVDDDPAQWHEFAEPELRAA